MSKKKEIDCPFDDEFIDAVKYMLYHTNAGGQAANPPHPSWYMAANDPGNSAERYEERKLNGSNGLNGLNGPECLTDKKQ